ncbi:MAG: adenylate/guanylate cyclase domain-containing protein, partial [Leptospiraceae bacterium]|nr:adenylate/guanylate cyclase domain-containing protein [Leptospiraceae bacterium]
MKAKFENTVARFTIYGILFGLCFPMFSCITFCSLSEGGFSFSKAVQLHATNLLQQVIDLAPFVLGFMGYLIGLKQKSLEDSKRRIEELYEITEKFYPVKFLQFLKKGTSFVTLGDNLEIEATILFTDIRDFTKLSEKLSPKEVMDFMNEYLAVCVPIIEKHGGIIDKFIGDSIMVVYPTIPEEALDSVIEMKKALDIYNEQRLLSGKQLIRTGFGLHYGKLALGTIGTEQRMQTTVFGDAVNLASRVESLTKEFKIWVLMTGDFAIKVANANRFHIREIDIAKVRGKAQSVPVYECYDIDDSGIISLKDSYKFDLLMAMNAYR